MAGRFFQVRFYLVFDIFYMQTIRNNPFIAVKQSLQPLADYRSRVLILDTMPTEKSLILQQYYPHTTNHFWKIIGRVLGEFCPSAYKLKKQLLLKHGIALWNVMELETPDNDLGMALRQNDFMTFFQLYPDVQRILFNGNQAATLYKKHIASNLGITFATLPSTSAINTWKSAHQKTSLWTEEIQKLLLQADVAHRKL
jgi:hypoxanthine-DNA glycosylase